MGGFGISPLLHAHRGLFGTMATIAKEEGPRALWAGLEPGRKSYHHGWRCSASQSMCLACASINCTRGWKCACWCTCRLLSALALTAGKASIFQRAQADSQHVATA
eukprot:scaffold142461_cov16-Tisochrysis_lutea.AAC.1